MSTVDGLDSLRGQCPVPFLAESKFPSTGGYVLGRICASVPGIADGESCCLPCNSVYWLYPDSFYSLTRIPGYIAIGSLALCIYLLISFIVLPKKCTNRHYLNTCLTISIIILELGFVVPVLARPQQCYNQITPNGIQSSLTCAWSGAFVIFGGVAVNSWILVRALNMHLLICWNMTPGSKFFYGAQVFAWGLSIVLLGTCISLTGVSFRFGDYCHVNHHLAIATYWGPLLTFAGLSVLIQLSTFGYCLNVYLTSTWADNERKDTLDSRSSSVGSARAKSARAVYRRVRKVVEIQWRGLCIALCGVIDVVYFSLVFIILDNKSSAAIHNIPEILPWVGCLVANNGDKDQCLVEASRLSVGEATLIATLVLLSIIGFENALLIGSSGMITGWKEVFTRRKSQSKFLPLHDDASPARTYEMLKIGASVADTPSTIFTPAREAHSDTMRSPDDGHIFALSSPRSTTGLIDSTAPKSDSEYFPSESKSPGSKAAYHQKRSGGSSEDPMANTERAYHSPRMSFSSPRSPATFVSSPRLAVPTNIQQESDWNVQSSMPSTNDARRGPLRFSSENTNVYSSGLGLHPVIRESSVYEQPRQDWSNEYEYGRGHG